MKNAITILIILVNFISCKTKDNRFEMISATKLIEILKDKKVQLVDVRTLEEFNLGHINNAQLIDVRLANFEVKSLQKLTKNNPVYIYCKSGKRSNKACAILKEKGFKVYNLKGGYLKWKLEKQQK